MKYVLQFGIIAGVSFLGELLNSLIDSPIPATVWGLAIMLFLLITGAVKLDSIEKTSNFLVSVMPIMFVPAAVGLIVSWDLLKAILLPVAVIIIVTTILVFAITGKTAEFIINRSSRNE